MAEYIGFQPTDFFSTKLYTGNGTAIGSGGNAITGVGFQPDFTWIKQRDASDNYILTDAVRGATKYVNSDRNNAEATNAESLTTWGADGFTLGNHAAVNGSGDTFASWNWKGGTTSGLVAGTHSVNSYSYNATSGFGIYQYTGDNTAGTITHGLGAVPKMIITKTLNSTVDWFVYHVTPGAGKYMVLNDTAAEGSSSIVWGNTTPTSTVFSLGAGAETNTSPNEYIAYVFADVKGYSKFGSYIGAGSTDGTFIYTGFRPAYFLIKANYSGEPWLVWNNKTEGFNSVAAASTGNHRLTVSSDAAESDSSDIDICSNGIKIRSADGHVGAGTYEYIYAAFAEFPIVSSNDVPTVAR